MGLTWIFLGLWFCGSERKWLQIQSFTLSMMCQSTTRPKIAGLFFLERYIFFAKSSFFFFFFMIDWLFFGIIDSDETQSKLWLCQLNASFDFNFLLKMKFKFLGPCMLRIFPGSCALHVAECSLLQWTCFIFLLNNFICYIVSYF